MNNRGNSISCFGNFYDHAIKFIGEVRDNLMGLLCPLGFFSSSFSSFLFGENKSLKLDRVLNKLDFEWDMFDPDPFLSD